MLHRPVELAAFIGAWRKLTFSAMQRRVGRYGIRTNVYQDLRYPMVGGQRFICVLKVTLKDALGHC